MVAVVVAVVMAAAVATVEAVEVAVAVAVGKCASDRLEPPESTHWQTPAHISSF